MFHSWRQTKTGSLDFLADPYKSDIGQRYSYKHLNLLQFADGIILNPGSGGATLWTDDITGSGHVQITKLSFGPLDTATLVSTADPFPVDLRTNNLSGNLNVSIAAAIPAGTNNIGDVDVLSVTPGAGATDLGKAEDAAHASGNIGVMALGVRQDTPGNLSGTSGDYEPFQIFEGRMWTSTVLTSSIPAGNNNIGDVDVASLPALPAGDNNIGNVDVVSLPALAAGTNNIGDVDVLSVIPGTGATSLGKAEDAAHSSGDTGVMALAVRQDTPGNLSGANGDYEPLQMSAGRLWVSAAITTALPTGSNTIGAVDLASAIPAGTNNIGDVDILSIAAGDNNIGNVDIASMANLTESLADDAAFTPATSRVVPVGFTFDDDTPDSVDEGDIGAARMSANRNQYVQIRDVSAERSAAVTAGNALRVDNSAVTQPVSGTVTANAGTGTHIVAGDVAHDSADSGSPVKMGAVGRSTHPTAVADGDRVNLYADRLGRLVTCPWAPLELIGDNRIVLSSTTETQLVAAGGAGVFRHLMALVISNESGTEVRVDIADGAAAGSTTDRLSIDLAADGGGAVAVITLPLKMGTANHIWTAQLSASVSSVYITAWYFANN